MSAVLDQALSDPPYRPLPPDASSLLRARHARPRLAAHLRSVHDVAAQLTAWLPTAFPAARFDRPAVLFGAATHDIGKIMHVEELSAPGSWHEPAGEQLLLAAGIAPRLARFAGTHGSWTAPGIELDDLLVSLADKIWRGRRQTDLEQLVVDRLALASGREPWEVFLALDDHLTTLASGACPLATGVWGVRAPIEPKLHTRVRGLLAMAIVAMYIMGVTPGYQVWRLATKWRVAVDRAVAGHGLTHAKYSVLATLYGLRHTDPGLQPSQRRLADHTGMEALYISKLVRALEADGLVERLPDPADTRAVRLVLTDRGLAVAAETVQVVHGLLERLLAPLGGLESGRTATFARELQLLIDNPLQGETP